MENQIAVGQLAVLETNVAKLHWAILLTRGTTPVFGPSQWRTAVPYDSPRFADLDNSASATPFQSAMTY